MYVCVVSVARTGPQGQRGCLDVSFSVCLGGSLAAWCFLVINSKDFECCIQCKTKKRKVFQYVYFLV